MEVTANLLPLPWLLAGWGLLIGVLVATRPAWVWTFDDRRYLQS